jgi:uncharacterized cupredoxin-like copper-binding protein
MRRSMPRYALLCAATVLLVASGCSSSGGEGDVSATEADFTIALDPGTATAGEVTFDIENTAGQTHEFVVFQTDLAPDALPTDDEGLVDESGEGLTLIDEAEDIAGGSSTTLAVSLDAGKYVVICNLPGHYAQGMHAPLTVS